MMKKIYLSTALTLTLIAGITAEARSVKPFIAADLDMIHIQPNSSLSDERINYGSVVVSQIDGDIRLTLERAFHCPANKMCVQVMPLPLHYKVTNFETTVGGCQEKIYTGVADKLPVDGTRTEITVIDNTTNVCLHITPVPATEVVLKLTAPRISEETHIFEGPALK